MAAQRLNVSMYELMERAGRAAFELIPLNWPNAKHIVVAVGGGNNGGDGYVLARLARLAGMNVTLCSPAADRTLSGDALTAQTAWFDMGESILDEVNVDFSECDLIVDALLGTGLNGEVKTPYVECIQRINESHTPVFSLDIPSGLHADQGTVLGGAVSADATVTFVGVKPGLTTGIGKEMTGTLYFDDLKIGEAFKELANSLVDRIAYEDFMPLPKRRLNAHKGTFGRLLCIGGNRGMSGAIRLSGEAALRCGAGLVRVYCHHQSMLQVSTGRPELMISDDNLSQHLSWADCVVLGPGLGQDGWSRSVFNEVLSYLVHNDMPIIIDADGLNLLSDHLHKLKLSNLVITPHPAEAARLLNIQTADVEANRFEAAQQLAKKFGGTCVLKGAGSVICHTDTTSVCEGGNPGMASAGMGDVLAGIIGALLAQGMTAADAGLYATCLHAAAGDLAAEKNGQRGMLASDLYSELNKLINS